MTRAFVAIHPPPYVLDAVAPLGYRRDHGREFVPHLTIARIRTRTDLLPLRAAIGSDPVGEVWSVSDFGLFESVLRPEGAQHLARLRVQLPR